MNTSHKNTDVKTMEKRIFIKINFNNEMVGYSKMSIPEKFQFITKLINDNIHNISKKINLTDNIIFEKETPYKNTIFFTAYTKPNYNHPIVGFISRNNMANKITLIRPIGRKRHNLDMVLLGNYITLLNIQIKQTLNNKNVNNIKTNVNIIQNNIILYAIYLSIIKSIIARKEEIIINPDYSLLHCYNMNACIIKPSLDIKMKKTKKQLLAEVRKGNKLTLKSISTSTYGDLSNDVINIIKTSRKNASKVLKRYFTYLETYDFNNAENMIGTLTTTFKQKKKNLGHLEIFIPLYKLIQIITNKVNI